MAVKAETAPDAMWEFAQQQILDSLQRNQKRNGLASEPQTKTDDRTGLFNIEVDGLNVEVDLPACTFCLRVPKGRITVARPVQPNHGKAGTEYVGTSLTRLNGRYEQTKTEIARVQDCLLVGLRPEINPDQKPIPYMIIPFGQNPMGALQEVDKKVQALLKANLSQVTT